MVLEVGVPDEWSPALTLATRALLQQAVEAGFPVIASVRPDATADQVGSLYSQIIALIDEAGLAA
jgi:hypothetical protein